MILHIQGDSEIIVNKFGKKGLFISFFFIYVCLIWRNLGVTITFFCIFYFMFKYNMYYIQFVFNYLFRIFYINTYVCIKIVIIYFWFFQLTIYCTNILKWVFCTFSPNYRLIFLNYNLLFKYKRIFSI